jgi:hypothetical protein
MFYSLQKCTTKMQPLNQNHNHNFVNPAFAGIFDGVTAYMPQITFYGIIATYAITALLNVFFIPLPFLVSIPAAGAIAFTRYAIVFMDFLNPTGRRSVWPLVIAFGLTVVALVELGFSIQEFGWAEDKFWATFLFGSTIIAGGYLLEVNFIAKGAEAFGLGQATQKQQGVLSSATATTPPPVDVTALMAEIEFLKNQISATAPSTPAPTGNGQAPVKTKPATANLGHLPSAGMNGQSLNHHNP